MYVCLCVGVSDREIQKTLREGACTVEEVMYCTGAGTQCGSCVPTIEAIVTEDVREDGEAKSCRRRLEVVRVVTSAA
jgi:bacterioferritin-associated ferredoxin